MAQTTSVLWSVDQGLGEDAKAQARQNIGAAAAEDIPTNKSEIKVFEGSSTVHKNLMTIYEDSTTGAMAGVNFNNENSKVTMVKEPAEGDGGKVLTVVEPGGQIAPYYEWKENKAGDSEEWYLSKSLSTPIATTLLATQFMSNSDDDVNEFFGYIGLQTSNTSSGNYALVPCDKDGHYLSSLGSQCVNIGSLSDTKVHHFGFYFKSDTTNKVRYIGVKGDSGRNVTITHLMVQKK